MLYHCARSSSSSNFSLIPRTWVSTWPCSSTRPSSASTASASRAPIEISASAATRDGRHAPRHTMPTRCIGPHPPAPASNSSGVLYPAIARRRPPSGFSGTTRSACAHGSAAISRTLLAGRLVIDDARRAPAALARRMSEPRELRGLHPPWTPTPASASLDDVAKLARGAELDAVLASGARRLRSQRAADYSSRGAFLRAGLARRLLARGLRGGGRLGRGGRLLRARALRGARRLRGAGAAASRRRRRPPPRRALARRELEAVAAVVLEHERGRERAAEARREVGEQLGLARRAGSESPPRA